MTSPIYIPVALQNTNMSLIYNLENNCIASIHTPTINTTSPTFNQTDFDRQTNQFKSNICGNYTSYFGFGPYM